MGAAASLSEIPDETSSETKIRMLETRIKLLEERVGGQGKKALLEKSSCAESVSSKNTVFDEGVLDTYKLRLMNIKEYPETSKVELPRGGFYVKSCIGPVQFGIPPETIKCSMNLGLKVPSYYVVPPLRFNIRQGINMAEIEFPAYFNFFLLQSKVHIICTPEQEVALRCYFTETIEGPAKEHIHLEVDYAGSRKCNSSWLGRPDLLKEIGYFKEPRNGREINCDTLVQFHTFDENNRVLLHSGNESHLVIVNNVMESRFDVYEEDNLEVFQYVTYQEANFVPTPEVFSKLHNKYKLLCSLEDSEFLGYSQSSDKFKEKDSSSATSAADSSSDFSVPPSFGVTFLGTSHGFDDNGVTTGFIVWIYGQGVYVDPPPHSDSYLISNQISPRKVQKIILTHCHADHDAGSFQKLLQEKKIELVTTRTIYQEFVRKYSIISDIPEEILFSVIKFEEVHIDYPHKIYGAEFRFFYSLHALPCIGFKVLCGGKSLAFSGDTFYDEDGLKNLRDKGIISENRRQSLMNFPWKVDLLLHECGIPPIHTPVSALQNLPDEVKQNLYVVHIADQVAEKANLRKAPLGFLNSLLLDPIEQQHGVAIQIIRVFSRSEIFKNIGLSTCALLLEIGNIRKYAKGSIFEGEFQGSFFMVLEGTIVIKRIGRSKRYLSVGDFFGELSCYSNLSEKLCFHAVTAVKIFELDSFGLYQLSKSSKQLDAQLKILSDLRGSSFALLCRRNSVLSNLSSSQLIDLKLSIENTYVSQMTSALDSSVPILIKDGEIELKYEAKEEINGKSTSSQISFLPKKGITLGTGAIFVGESIMHSLKLGSSRASMQLSVSVKSECCEIHVLNIQRFTEFINANPYVRLALIRGDGILTNLKL